MNLKFTCPKCQHNLLEEIMHDAVVTSECYFDDEDNFTYGEQTNDGGHVDRYQCASCGYVLLAQRHCDAETGEGICDETLAEVLREMNTKAEKETEDNVVSHGELVQRIADAHEGLDGKELAELFNGMFPNNPVKYDGDSIYKWDEND